MNRRVFAGLAVCLGLSACAHPELHRFNAESTTFTEGANMAMSKEEGPQLDVYAYSPPSAPSPKPAPTVLKDLSDRAQAAIVAAAVAGSDKVEAVEALAASPFEAKPDPVPGTGVTISSVIDRTLVINLSKGTDFKPGERVTWAQVRIVPKNFEFAGYSVAATDSKVVNVASLTNTTSATLTAGVTPTLLADVKGTGALQGVFGQTKAATASVEDTVVSLDVGIRPKLLRIVRESGRNGDVVGNTFVALSLDLTGLMNGDDALNGLLVKKQELIKGDDWMEEKDSKAKVVMAQYPPACDLKADIELVYQQRVITKGADTYLEGDDAADYRRDLAPLPNQTLVRGVDVRPRLWWVMGQGGTTAAPEFAVISGRTPFGEMGPLLFSSYADARTFATWMAAKNAVKVGALTLYWNGGVIGAAHPRPYAQIIEPNDCEKKKNKPAGGGAH